MAKYRKTALIEATQLTDEMIRAHVLLKAPLPAGVECVASGFHQERGTVSYARLRVKTLEGDMEAKAGDWIATGVKGEHWPIADDVFRATYEPA